jgi:hypothetical protein
MIPPLGPDGALPPGIHDAADWEEVVARLAGTDRREELLAKLRRGLDNLREAGCPWVLLDGSFVTDKPEPNDIDGCWHYGPEIDRGRLDPCFLPYLAAQKQMLKLRYGMDFYRANSVEATSGLSFPEFFQADREGNRRGVIRLDLSAEQARETADPTNRGAE